jgi:putative phosphoesterase
MKIGVMSDTHGNLAFLKEAAEYLVKQEKVDRLYHLGDTYQDGRRLLKYDVPVVGVPGIYDPEYFEPIYENEVREECLGVRFLLVHDRTKLKPAALKKTDVVLSGHTHRYEIKRDEETDIIYCNPGHLKAPIDKQREPSFAVITVDDLVVAVKLKDLKGNVLEEKKFIL